MGSIGNNTQSISDLDFSVQGTMNFDGQQVPKGGLRAYADQIRDNTTNLTINWQGTEYTVQAVIDYNSAQGGEYIAGHLFVPTIEDFASDSNKGSFFISKDLTLYKDGTQYLNDIRRRNNMGSIGNTRESGEPVAREPFVVGNNPPTAKEQAYMNYKAIRISKNMPKEEQARLRKLKAEYRKQWKG